MCLRKVYTLYLRRANKALYAHKPQVPILSVDSDVVSRRGQCLREQNPWRS
jgi:hypothetical protein